MSAPKKLIALVADTEMKYCVAGLLERFPITEMIPNFEFEVIAHSQHDPGCLLTPEIVLRKYLNTCEFAIVIFDYDGCGQIGPVAELENEVKRKLSQNGWVDRCACVIIEPELENWIWVDSKHVADALHWNSFEDLKNFLITKKFWDPTKPKPDRPKEAAEEAILAKRQIWSPRIHQAIAQKASFKYCTSPSFLKFKSTITTWFQAQNP